MEIGLPWGCLTKRRVIRLGVCPILPFNSDVSTIMISLDIGQWHIQQNCSALFKEKDQCKDINTLYKYCTYVYFVSYFMLFVHVFLKSYLYLILDDDIPHLM